MKHHEIFERFERQPCVGTGQHVLDFLGVATNADFKKGWERFAPPAGAKLLPNYPPVNEHYFDWIALLTTVVKAKGPFRMAELGAGWAPWLVRGAFACRQNPSIDSVELVGVEADPTHYSWMLQHFQENDVPIKEGHLVEAAVAASAGTLRFPRIQDPDVDYGASLRGGAVAEDYIEVRAVALADLLDQFLGPLDFLHVDIQGAEYDVIPGAMDLLSERVRAIMIGTHLSAEGHESMYKLFHEAGWRCEINFPRNEKVETGFGEVQFGDGFQFWINPKQLPA